MFKKRTEYNFKFELFYPKLSKDTHLVFSFFISNHFINNTHFENKNKRLKSQEKKKIASFVF